MNPHDKDKDSLDQDLAMLVDEYGREPGEVPPDLVDMAVLNKAKAAVEKPRRAWPWTRGWAHNLATASVVVIAATLLIQMRQESPSPVEPEALMKEQSSDLDVQLMKQEAYPVDSARRERAKPRVSPSGEEGLEIESPGAMSAPLTTNPASGARPEAVMAEPEADAVDAALLEISPQPQAGDFRQVIPQADPALEAAPALSESVGPATGDEDSLGEAIEMSEEEARMSARQNRVASPARNEAVATPLPAEEWIERLLELKQEEQLDEFARQLEAFRAAYPDHPLPEDLLE